MRVCAWGHTQTPPQLSRRRNACEENMRMCSGCVFRCVLWGVWGVGSGVPQVKVVDAKWF